MMGQQPRTDSLFYYFRLEDQIPDDHLLKRLDRFIDFGFVRERLRDTYSATGRPSIDSEVLLRLLLVGYLYGITSERRLMEEVRMHLQFFSFSVSSSSSPKTRSDSGSATGTPPDIPTRLSGPPSLLARRAALAVGSKIAACRPRRGSCRRGSASQEFRE